MSIAELQGHAMFYYIVVLTVLLYGYIFHLYRSEKKGERDYEKYGDLAIHDEITDTPLEARPTNKKSKES